MEQTLPEIIRENKDLQKVLLKQEGGIMKFWAEHLDADGRDTLFKKYQKKCAEDYYDANKWEMSEEEAICNALGYAHMEKELDYQLPIHGEISKEIAKEINRNIDEYLKFAYNEQRKHIYPDGISSRELYRETISLYHTDGLAYKCMDILLREHRAQGKAWSYVSDFDTTFRIQMISEVVLADKMHFGKLRKAVAEMLEGKTDEECRRMAAETMMEVRGFSQIIYSDSMVSHLRDPEYKGKYYALADQKENESEWLRGLVRNALKYESTSMQSYFTNFVFLLMDIGRIWAAQLLANHHIDMHELETEICCIMKPIEKPAWDDENYVDYSYYRDKYYIGDLPDEYCVYNAERAKELLSKKQIEQLNIEKRQLLLESNTVISHLDNTGKPKIDLLNLYHFIDVHFTRHIKQKYEWYALRRFLLEYDLLNDGYNNVKIEKQMNHPEWFGYLEDEKHCSQSEMNIYNILNDLEPKEWRTKWKTKTTSTKATQDAVENIYKRYQHLDNFKFELFNRHQNNN